MTNIPKVFFKQMENRRVYTSMSPKGIFVKIDRKIWFQSYWNDAISQFKIVKDLAILSPSEHFVTELTEHSIPVFPKKVTLA
jgi:hypothetical protein